MSNADGVRQKEDCLLLGLVDENRLDARSVLRGIPPNNGHVAHRQHIPEALCANADGAWGVG